MSEQTRRGTPSGNILRKSVESLSEALVGNRVLQVDIRSLSVRGPVEAGGEILIVIKGVDGEGAKLVSFHSAYSLADAIKGIASRIDNGSLRWRQDEYN